MQTTTSAQELVLIPLAALRPSRRNARKTGGTPIKQLARSIERVGLLQNLTVTANGGKHYEVEAGKRRLAALQLLAKRKRLPKSYEVPCLVVPDAAARTASLTENTQRSAMHPADEFEAFKALVEEGKSIEDIAADFGVTPLTVQRRLRLANVSPRLLADYRKGQVTLEQLMALAVTDDHKAQEQAFYEVPEWQRDPRTLREHLTSEDADAARDPVARFVGFEAYEQAGGGYRRDLFADQGQGVYLTDRALLDRLATDRLKETAATVEAEGWAWVEVVPRSTPSELYAFRRVQPKRRKPSRREAQAIVKLRRRMRLIDTTPQGEDAEIDEAQATALQEEREAIAVKLEAAEQALAEYSPKARAVAGVVVTVDAGGNAVVHRGLVRESDAKQAQAEDGNAEGADPGKKKRTATAKNPGVSEKLARQLSAHRTAAIQAELARQPQVALVAVVHRLVLKLFYEVRHTDAPLQLDGTPQTKLDRYAPDLPGSPAVAALAEVRQGWKARLPAEPEALFIALRELSQDDLLSLLAVCAAGCVDAVSPREADGRAGELSAALGLDMAQWWTPTAAGYFAQVSKARIFEAIKSFAPEYVKQLELAKKPELAARAEELAAGKGWLPEMLRRTA
ncbi:MAG: ParB N-terminal domain-containing protein [Nevskia sp.]|nr:ParB N-terminal domain-containing protein [Nevskia sp.]